MKVSTIETGLFKLDGGAMFGVVPKQLWNKLNPADDQNMCVWSMRSMLVEINDRKILIDTGLGDKQDDKFQSHFEPHGPFSLQNSIEDKALYLEDITDVFITHLHFDHVGGAVIKSANGKLEPLFPNATYWISKPHFDSAIDPNPRERASFLQENFMPLVKEGMVKFISEDTGLVDFEDGFKIKFVNGHTRSMMLPILKHDNKTIIYAADLIPSAAHVGMPYVMSYDLHPLKTMEEKEWLYNFIGEEEAYLFLEHDPKIELISLTKNNRGRIIVDNSYSLNEKF